MRPRGDLAGQGRLVRIEEWQGDVRLRDLVDACIERQRRVREAVGTPAFQPAERAGGAVAPEALDALLAEGRDVHGIARDPDISNVLVFNASQRGDSVLDRGLRRLREELDRAVAERARGLFPEDRVLCLDSGHFWYPPGGYMGWHTNSRAPGWRLYLTRAAAAGRSFFRYRDPATGEIHTSMDSEWDVRMFHVTAREPFWHAVYSETDRFSFGYLVMPWSLLASLQRWRRRLRSRIAESRRSGPKLGSAS